MDASTGLYFYQARYYDPQVGRFISPDPIVQAPDDPQSLNRYSYVRNNPVKYVDPSGYFFGLDDFIGWIISIIVTVAVTAATSGGDSGGGGSGGRRSARPAPTKTWALKDTGRRFYQSPVPVYPSSEQIEQVAERGLQTVSHEAQEVLDQGRQVAHDLGVSAGRGEFRGHNT